MNSEAIINVLTQLVCIVLSLILIIYFSFRENKTRVTYTYTWCILIILIWSVGQLLQTFSFDTQSQWVLEVFKFIGMSYIGLSWLLFCIFYTENDLRTKRTLLILLFIPPTFTFIAILTNDFHHLFYIFFKYSYFDAGRLKFGPFMYYHGVVTYLYIIIGLYIIIRYAKASNGYNKRQSYILFFGAAVVFIYNLVTVVINTIPLNYNPTPFAFIIYLLLIWYSARKYKFLDLTPIAFKNAFNIANTNIMIIDKSDNIVQTNKLFINTFGSILNIDSLEKLSDFIGQIVGKIYNDEDSNEFKNYLKHESMSLSGYELSLRQPELKFYNVTIQPILDIRKKYLGKIISFYDITDHKILLHSLNSSNNRLAAANKRLKEHAAVVEQLAVESERNRFARDVHDTVGHSMTLIISLLMLAQIEFSKSPQGAYDKITEAIKISRQGLNDLRSSLNGINPGISERNNISVVIGSMIGSFKSTGTNIQLFIDGYEPIINDTYSSVIYRVCQEALTNSLRHGNASNINIFLKFKEDKIQIYIFDDGKGCENIVKGFGLTSMESRVNSINGTIAYGSGDEGGFNLRVEIPMGGNTND